MAYGTFQLGTHQFSGITGSLSVAAPVDRVRIEERIGVDGFQITNLGAAGQMSQLVSFRDLSSWEAGFQLYEDYRSLIGQGPQQLTINDIEMDDYDFRVVVLNVERLAHHPSPVIVGNTIEAFPAAILECRWTVMTRTHPVP